MILIALLSAVGFLIIILKAFGLKQVIEYKVWIDIAFTVGFLAISSGTLGGITIAVTSGVMLSIMLAILRILCRK